MPKIGHTPAAIVRCCIFLSGHFDNSLYLQNCQESDAYIVFLNKILLALPYGFCNFPARPNGPHQHIKE